MLLAPSNLYINDEIPGHKDSAFRRESIAALTEGMGIDNIFFDGNTNGAKLGSAGPLCFDLLVQKVVHPAGDPLDLQFYRQKVFEYSQRYTFIFSHQIQFLHYN